ncbi:MAG TPA: hypothetical protein VFK33_07225 [Bacillales bacterium]|nr:hypothetical protein [Bacillales bacterium]
MDFMKLKVYLDILGICFTVALSYIFIANLFLGRADQNDLLSIGILAFGWAVILTNNQVARELWRKWIHKE